MLKIRVYLFVFFYSLVGISQHNPHEISVSGTVLSYTYDDTKSIFKKEKQIEVEGSLAKAEIAVSNNQGKVVYKTETDHGGKFYFSIPLGELYTITYSKVGYGTSAFELDVRTIPAEYASWGLMLINLDLILNNYESDKAQDNGESFGRLSFEASLERFKFIPVEFDQKKRLFKKEEDNTSVSLMLNSVEKNRPFNRLDTRESPVEEVILPAAVANNRRKVVAVETNVDSTKSYLESLEKTRQAINNHKDINFLSSEFSLTELDAFASEIEHARLELEKDRLNAMTEADFLNIEARERLLTSAETQLANARLFIDSQSATIAAQHSFIYALIGLTALLVVLGIFMYLAYRSKKANLAILAAKNHKIAESIKYATRIQQSVLLSDQQIKAMLPKSFVFHQPLDAVSGDFYWFSKINSTLVMAAVDCTGHGVPGAFMSLIGNTLMNQIVNEKHITEPKEILNALHEGIVRSLNQSEDDESAQDGMDIAVCTLDESTNKLTFSGANNSIYIIQNGEIKNIPASILAVGGYVRRNKSLNFKQNEFLLNAGDRIYLFSDGYMDQFGGEKDEKYNISRFTKLLSSLMGVSMQDQKEKFTNSLKDWKGDKPQTDDVLVIGVEI